MKMIVANIFTAGFLYDVSKDGGGNVDGSPINFISPVQVPAGATFFSCTFKTIRTLVKDPDSGDPFLGIGTINNTTLCTGNLANYSLWTGGTGFNATTPVGIMDNTLNMLVHMEDGALIDGAFITYLQYFFP